VATRCTACLGTRKCWVCLGHGKTEIRPGSYEQCPRCDGSGACPECLDLARSIKAEVVVDPGRKRRARSQ